MLESEATPRSRNETMNSYVDRQPAVKKKTQLSQSKAHTFWLQISSDSTLDVSIHERVDRCVVPLSLIGLFPSSKMKALWSRLMGKLKGEPAPRSWTPLASTCPKWA